LLLRLDAGSLYQFAAHLQSLADSVGELAG
jgi:hypothetical protein